MKKLLFPAAIIALLSISSCKDDFEVAAPYKNITVAYGIINAADTAHYIRIEKAFLDNNKSAIDMSQVADSSFFKSLDVVLKEYNFDNKALRRTLPMYRVNLNNEGYPKDAAGNQGFFRDPSYAYKLKMAAGDSLNPYYVYRIVIKNNATGITDSSDFIAVVNSATTNNAQNFYISAFNNLNYSLGFAKTQFKASFTLFGITPRNAKMIEGIMRFHMVEKNAATGEKKRLSASYTFASDVKTGSQQFKLEVLNSSIYSFLYDAFGPAPLNVQRYIDSCDVFVYAGSSELYNYQTLALVQNGSLIGDQIKPIFTNMRGETSYGIVASRALNSYKNVPIDQTTIDSIKLNSITKPLGIVGRSDE